MKTRLTPFVFLRNLYHLLVILVITVASLNAKERPQKILKGGWYLWDPYQYIEKGQGYVQLNGLDINLQKAIAKQARYEIYFEQVPWKQHLDDLKEGRRDIAAGVTKTKDRGAYGYFSDPYRYESDSLFTLKHTDKKLIFSNIDEFMDQIQRKGFRLGVVDGYVYVDRKINQFIADPQNSPYIRRADNTYENVEDLMTGKIDGFLADRIDGATALWRSNNREKVIERVIGLVPIHLMFSKKTTSPEIVHLFNQAIQKIKDSGEYDSIIQSYLFPILLMQTIDRDWFIIIDLVGTIAFALSGLMIAYQERASFFKAILLATLPAVGGGIIRDLVAGRTPLGVLRTPVYMIAILSTILCTYVLIRLFHKMVVYRHRFSLGPIAQDVFMKKGPHGKAFGLFIDIFDALGLAAFTVIGVTVAFSSKTSPLWIWGPAFAVITGVGGGIIRDLLREDKQIWALKGEFYAEIPCIWGIFLTLYLLFNKQYTSPDAIFYAVIATLLGAFLMRLIIVGFRIKAPSFRPSSPSFSPPSSSDS